MKHGIVLGKFMPLHLGHEHLINTAIDHCNRVTVVVCTLAIEPIEGQLRYQWLVKRYVDQIAKGKVKIAHLKEEWMPQAPEDCYSKEVFYGTWAGTLNVLAKEPIDMIFTSEDYGFPVAQYLGCEHVLVDKQRKQVPISGTEIRNHPISNWSFMNKDVRKYFTRKVLVIGAESTGKSTLTEQLGQHFSNEGYAVKAIQEYAREWIDNYLGGQMEQMKFEHITLFGKTQMELVERSRVEEDKQLIFSDTDAITSAIFQQIYFGKVDQELLALSYMEKWDLILFTQPDVPWVDDGQRNLADRRFEINQMFKAELEKRNLSYVEVKGNWEERMEIAVQAVREVTR